MNLTERAMLLFGMNEKLCDTNYENTPDRLRKSVGVCSVFCVSNLFIRRGDHWSPLQKNQLPYEKKPLPRLFYNVLLHQNLLRHFLFAVGAGVKCAAFFLS